MKKTVRDHIGHEVSMCIDTTGRAFVYCSDCREEASVGHIHGTGGKPSVVSGVLRDVNGRLEMEVAA